MMTRMTVALGATLLFVGAAVAQPPAAAPPLLLPPVPESLVPNNVTADAARPAVPENPNTSTTGPQLWATADYLLTWIRNDRLPPLVTTSPPGTAQAVAGIPGNAGTTTLFGGSINGDVRSGVRLGAGYWFSPERTFGVEAGAMMVESQAAGFSGDFNAFPILARPFVDATNNSAQAVLVSFPGLVNGAINVRDRSGNFYEGHFDIAANAADLGWFRLNALLGYRIYQYDEGLRIQQSMSPTAAAFVPGTQIAAVDNFGTRNLFNGVDLGLRSQMTWEAFSLDLLANVAVGNLHQTVNIDGSTLVTVPGVAPVLSAGGIYALPTNIGAHSKNTLSVLPELGANAGWRITPNICLRAGYSILFLDQVARAGDQVDTSISPSRFPIAGVAPNGPPRPAFSLNRTNIFVESVTFGVEFSY